jgi:hypothetical protein
MALPLPKTHDQVVKTATWRMSRPMSVLPQAALISSVAALSLGFSGCAQMPAQPIPALSGTQQTTAGTAQAKDPAGVSKSLLGLILPVTPNGAGSAAGDTQQFLAQLVSLSASNPEPLATRQAASLRALYAKRNLTGAELIDEMRAMREAMRADRSAKAVGRLLGAATGGTGGSSANLTVGNLAVAALQELARQYVTSLAFSALDAHLTTLIDDPQLLANERITLPDGKGLNATQLQRGVTMAAIVVATRLTNKVLSKAKADFAGVDKEYDQLLQRREQAATLLYQALGQGLGGSTAVGKTFSAKDLAFLQGAAKTMTLREFAGDMGAQNLALAYLQSSDPSAFAQYRARTDEVVGKTRAYIRSVSGVVAASGLVVTFVQEVVNVYRTRNADELITLMPYALDFAKELRPLAVLLAEVGAHGVELPFKGGKQFRVVQADGTEELSTAEDVFTALRKRQADTVLADALFRTESPGLIYKLYQCDRAEAGRLLDEAVPLDRREKFAQEYQLGDPARFSFANAFEQPRDIPAERALGEELLRRDHRERTSDRTLSLATVQKIATGRPLEGGERLSKSTYARWGEEQLMRLIFANREGAASDATLQLGQVLVRPIPSMAAIYAYESLVDGCKKNLVGTGKPAPPGGDKPQSPAKPTPPRPPAKPTTTPPKLPG